MAAVGAEAAGTDVGAEAGGAAASGAETAGAVAGAAATGAEAAGAAATGAAAVGAVAGAAATGVEAERVVAAATTAGAVAVFAADVVDAVGFVEVRDVVELAGLVLVGVGLATTTGVDDVDGSGAADTAGVDVAVLEGGADVAADVEAAGVEVAVEGDAEAVGDEVEVDELVVDWVVDPEIPDAAFKIDCNGRATTYGFPSTAVAGAEKEMVEPDVELAQALPPIANVMTVTVTRHVTPRIALRTSECTQPSLRVSQKWGET